MIKQILFNLLGLYNCKHCNKAFKQKGHYQVTTKLLQPVVDVDGVESTIVNTTVHHSSSQYCSKKCMIKDLKTVKPPKHFNCKSVLHQKVHNNINLK